DHPLVDLAEENHVRPVSLENVANRLDIAKTLDVPDGDAHRPVASLPDRPCAAQLDLPQRRYPRKVPPVRVGVERAVAPRLAPRKGDLRDGGDRPLDGAVDPVDRVGGGHSCSRTQKNVLMAPVTLCRSSIS